MEVKKQIDKLQHIIVYNKQNKTNSKNKHKLYT